MFDFTTEPKPVTPVADEGVNVEEKMKMSKATWGAVTGVKIN